MAHSSRAGSRSDPPPPSWRRTRMRWPRQTCTQGLVPLVHDLVPRVHDPSRSGRHPSRLVAPGLQPNTWPCADHPFCQCCQVPLLNLPTLTRDATSGARHAGISLVGVGLPWRGVGDRAGPRAWSLAGRVSPLRASIRVAGRWCAHAAWSPGVQVSTAKIYMSAGACPRGEVHTPMHP
jgi:hypothetical protein